MKEYYIMFNDSSLRMIKATEFSLANNVLKFYYDSKVIAIFNLENIAGFSEEYFVIRPI